MNFDTWEAAKAAALGRLSKAGAKNAKVPDPKVSYTKFKSDMAKLSKEFDTAVDQLQAKILAMQTQCQTVKLALKQYGDQVSKETFNQPKGGDPTGPLALTLHDVQGMLQGFADDKSATIDGTLKSLDDLEKKSVDLEKFEAST
jgi:hypothetical protein